MRVKNFKEIRFEVIEKMPISLLYSDYKRYYLTLAVIFFDVLLWKLNNKNNYILKNNGK